MLVQEAFAKCIVRKKLPESPEKWFYGIVLLQQPIRKIVRKIAFVLPQKKPVNVVDTLAKMLCRISL